MDWLSKRSESVAPERRFQLAEEAARKMFDPGQILDSNARLIGLGHVLIVGNSNLRADALVPRGRDYQSIGNIIYPGKSAVLDFLGANLTGQATKEDRNVVTTRTFGKETDRHDALYIAPIDKISEAGFDVYYAPVRTNGLRVRIVSRLMYALEFPVIAEIKFPESVLERLKGVFTKVATV